MMARTGLGPRKAETIIVLFMLAFLSPVSSPAVDRPLTKDDVSLLLIGGASTAKMIALIQQRGVDFRLTPELAQKFHRDGASDDVVDALWKAGEKWATAKASATAPTSPAPSAASSPPASTPPVTAQSVSAAAAPPANASTPAPVQQQITAALAAADKTDKGEAAGGARVTAAAGRPSAAAPDLSDPSADRAQQIVQEFAAKETLFKAARDNYTYHQINKIETLDPDGNPDGVYQQEWDILYDDKGARIEHVTYAPVSTLQRVIMTPEDLNAMRNIQPFVLTSTELPDYEIKYLGHVKVDEITAFVFSIRPKELKKGHQYFQGVVWVDDRDLQIVKTEGKPVGELVKSKKGENLFPRFTTYREQIDGKFWFPTYTIADDKLYFEAGPVHIKEIIRYSDYKQFKSKVRIISVAPTDQPSAPKAPEQK